MILSLTNDNADEKVTLPTFSFPRDVCKIPQSEQPIGAEYLRTLLTFSDLEVASCRNDQ